jgi:hypothetical protein
MSHRAGVRVAMSAATTIVRMTQLCREDARLASRKVMLFQIFSD